uniref:NADH dehydrogenase subunit 6 n=1 Tax=Araneae sp. MT-2014 TaxID=1560008 RepID=A0A0A0RV53_9ARAC|nr:NADH dehydrogenase subunit 6 [Araneae sp. MT-2014]
MVLMLMGVVFASGIQPIMMVSVLIMIVLLYSKNMWELMGSYWFSYVLVMVMLSGVLIVFTYMVSLIPNESFETYNLIFLSMFIVMMMSEVYGLYNNDKSVMVFNMWSSYLGIFNLFMVVYLLGVMIMVVWLSNLSEGAIRVY